MAACKRNELKTLSLAVKRPVMTRKLPFFICLFITVNFYFNASAQVSVAVMSIKGAEIKRVLNNYASGIIVLQFKTDDATHFYADASAYNSNINPPFTSIALQKLSNVSFPVDTFILSTLKWSYSLDSIPGGLDTSKTYYLIPFYESPYVLYKFSAQSPKTLLKNVKVDGYENLTFEMLNELDAATRRKVLGEIYNKLAAARSFNPVPPSLLP